MSRVSFSTLRNRTTAKTASSPNATMKLPAIRIIIKATSTGKTTSDTTNDCE